MKNLIFTILCLTGLSAYCQDTKKPIDVEKWTPPYKLDIPEGWGVERFLIPIEFAPQIPYTGVEDIRFTPGWGNSKSDEYWTYAFLWYLNESPEINESVIENNLKAYYTGLVGRNIEPRKIPAEKVIPVKTSIKLAMTDKGDLKTYSGTIDMLDYMEQKPITLNCIVHIKSCAGQNKTFIFYQISPKPYTHQVWQNLNRLWTEFKCN